MTNESSPGLRPRSVGLRGDWIVSITNVAPTAATTLTMAALIAASGLASPLALLIAGAAMLCCAVAYHRLNNWQASAAAPVEWVARGLSPIIGFSVGILVLMTALTSNIGNITLIGSTVLDLIAPSQANNKPLTWLVATIICLLVVAIAVIGVKVTIRFQGWVILVEYMIIASLAVWGLYTELTSHGPGITTPSWSWFTVSHSPGGSTGLIAGVVIATFLLGGWDSPIYLGDEQKRQRDSGRSVLISITFCTLWVVFLFVCLQGLAPSSDITNNASNVLPYLAGRIGPKGFADLVALAVIASFATTIQSQIVDGSRIMFGMGRDRTVPGQLGQVNSRFRTPVAGLVVMGVIPVIALILYLANDSLQKTIVYIDSTGGLLFAGYYVVISVYSIWYYRSVLFRDARDFLMGLLLPLVGAGDAGLCDRQVAARHAEPGEDHRAGAVPGRHPAGPAVQGDHPRALLLHQAGAVHRGDAAAGWVKHELRSRLMRSDAWLGGDDEVALNHRAALRAAGFRRSRGSPGSPGSRRSRRPLIGIASTASDLNRCDRGLSALAAAVRRGVEAAGGLPLEFPVMSLSEDLMKPTAMLYRNLLAIEVEETIRSQPLDGIVALGNCDKTVPAYLMALASADIPALIVTGGFRAVPSFRGERLGSGTALWRLYDARRAGTLGSAEWTRLETCLGRGLGACNTMGTASTMAIMAETLGMALSGSAVLAAGNARQLSLAEEAGRRIVSLVLDGVRPSSVLTPAGFANAMTVLAAVGGSTNAVIHLCAVAGRRGLSLPLREFAAVSARVPVILDLAPVGTGLMDDLARAGGVPAVLAAVAPHLDLSVPRMTGGCLGDSLPTGSLRWPLGSRVGSLPAFMVVHGNLAPDGAVIKAAAATPALLRHRGPAVVFHSYQEMRARVDDPSLGVSPDSVLVLAGCGPAGMAMPEWGNIPIPGKLLSQGVTDMLRITDGRMSGTGFGTVVLHVAPESAIGGPLSRLRDGDVVSLDAYAGSLSVAADLSAREPILPSFGDTRGWPVLHRMHVLQAPEGCDYDYLKPRTPEELAFVEPVIGRS